MRTGTFDIGFYGNRGLVKMNRRQFVDVISLAPLALQPGCSEKMVKPRWRGFNLQEKFTDRPDEWAAMDPEWGHNNDPFVKADFEWIAELGFNFVRLPMSYRCWTDPNNPYRLLEPVLLEIDQAVSWGREYGLHVCLNFHRAPGYCINSALSPEPWNLWTEQQPLDIFTFQWASFAERYKGISSQQLSFNLINEPNGCTPAEYARVIQHGTRAIREVDSSRLVTIDGMFGETMLPVPELLHVPNSVQSVRGYAPFNLTHYLAPWAGTPKLFPTWPTRIGTIVAWDKDRLDQYCVLPGQGVEYRVPGSRVMVGEFGCWNRTAHDTTISWMRDFLTLWKNADWGWALWCFRGSFGILDSERQDVSYENWRGHKLDRQMLELLREF